MALDDLFAVAAVFVYIIVPAGMIYFIFRAIGFVNRAVRRLGKHSK